MIAAAGRLEVRDLRPDAQFPPDPQRLGEGDVHLVGFVADVGRIERVRRLEVAPDLDDLFGVAVRPGRIHEAGAEAPRAVGKRLAHQPAHRRQLRGRRQPVVHAHRGDAECAVADQGHQVDGRPLRVEPVHELAEGAPVEVELGADAARQRAQLGLAVVAQFHGRRREAAVADHLARATLRQRVLGRRERGVREVGVRVEVDEARRQHQAVAVDHLAADRPGGARPHRGDSLTLDRDVGAPPGRAGPVVDRRPSDQIASHDDARYTADRRPAGRVCRLASATLRG